MVAEWTKALIPNSSRKHALGPRSKSFSGQKLWVPKISRNWLIWFKIHLLSNSPVTSTITEWTSSINIKRYIVTVYSDPNCTQILWLRFAVQFLPFQCMVTMGLFLFFVFIFSNPTGIKLTFNNFPGITILCGMSLVPTCSLAGTLTQLWDLAHSTAGFNTPQQHHLTTSSSAPFFASVIVSPWVSQLIVNLTSLGINLKT